MTRTWRDKARHASALTALALLVASFGSGAGATPSPDAAIAPPGEMGKSVRALPNGLYSVELDDGYTFTTHGGDPVATELGHGDRLGPEDPERDPVCATGHVQHILYGRPSLITPSRYEDVADQIRAHVRRMNAVLSEAAEESGGTTADYRVACDETGEIRVDEFENTSLVPYITTVVQAARDAGFDDPNVDYNIFYDGEFPGVCGIAEFSRDDRAVEENRNNDGGYAVTYENCWYSRTPMHENGHNQGAVQTGAPNEDGSNHCTEHEDIMCYPSASNECPDQMYFDCGFDTYFDAAPEPGEWLDSHWNIGSPLNRYIVFGADGAVDEPVELEAYLSAPRSPQRGSRVRMVAGTSECSEDAETIVLERKTAGEFQPVAEKAQDDECEATFTVKASFGRATFRSAWLSPEGETIVSPPVTIRTRR